MSSSAEAHTLKINGTIGATLHLDPDDEPVAGRDSRIFLEIRDASKQFLPQSCNCSVLVFRNEELLASFPIFLNGQGSQAFMQYLFPESGVYDIIVTGNSINSSAPFQPFTMAYEYYASASLKEGAFSAPIASGKKQNALREYVPYAVLAAGIFIILFLVPFQKKRNEKT